MGEKLEDIPVESYKPKKRGRFGSNDEERVTRPRRRSRRKDTNFEGKESFSRKSKDKRDKESDNARFSKKKEGKERSARFEGSEEKDYRRLPKKSESFMKKDKKNEIARKKKHDHNTPDGTRKRKSKKEA